MVNTVEHLVCPILSKYFNDQIFYNGKIKLILVIMIGVIIYNGSQNSHLSIGLANIHSVVHGN